VLQVEDQVNLPLHRDTVRTVVAERDRARRRGGRSDRGAVLEVIGTLFTRRLLVASRVVLAGAAGIWLAVA
jgi:hypothetical protein